MIQDSTPEIAPDSPVYDPQEQERLYYAEPIGHVVSVPLSDTGAHQLFYYCTPHANMGFSGEVDWRPLIRSQDPSGSIVCHLCHQRLTSVDYIEKEIARRRLTESTL